MNSWLLVGLVGSVIGILAVFHKIMAVAMVSAAGLPGVIKSYRGCRIAFVRPFINILRAVGRILTDQFVVVIVGVFMPVTNLYPTGGIAVCPFRQWTFTFNGKGDSVRSGDIQ